MPRPKINESKDKIDKLTFQLPLSLKIEFKAKIAKENKTVRDVLEDFVKKYTEEV